MNRHNFLQAQRRPILVLVLATKPLEWGLAGVILNDTWLQCVADMQEHLPNKVTNTLTFSSKAGRLHLAVAPDLEVLRANSSICGEYLGDSAEHIRVPPEDIAALHTFVICPNCSLHYLHGGYREFALSVIGIKPTTFTEELEAFLQRDGKNQLTLF
ncbi:hypothetical protein D3C75_983800 [compost metagenome]